MQNLVQVEIKSGSTHTMTWVPTSLKPRVDMLLTRKGPDNRVWGIVQAYTLTAQTDHADNSWKVVELART